MHPLKTQKGTYFEDIVVASASGLSGFDNGYNGNQPKQVTKVFAGSYLHLSSSEMVEWRGGISSKVASYTFHCQINK